jgi:hypothetical protein
MIRALKPCSEVPYPLVVTIHRSKAVLGHLSTADPQIRRACKQKKKTLMFRSRVKRTMRQFYMSLTEEPAAFIAIYASLAVKLTGITFSLFGLILIKDNYIRENLQNPETSAKSLIEVLSLIGNLATVPNGLFFGWLSDRFKAWKLLLLNLFVF